MFTLRHRDWITRCTVLLACLLALLPCSETSAQGDGVEEWVVYEGRDGPGEGKHIVFVSGDEEYRSEEALPMLAKILAVRHGFTCTVLFAVDPETGEIDPELQTNIPGLHLLETADMMVLFTRFRELPDDQMRYVVEFTNSGRPIMGLRTSTHAFQYERNADSPFAGYDWRSDEPPGGYGRLVFGETWVRHHGRHGEESTRGLINGLAADRPILNGVQDVWGPTDVYGLRDLPEDAEVLVHGLSLRGMEPSAPPNYDKALVPVAWTRTYEGETGNTSRVFFTTMGAAVDLESEDLRRLLVNAVYWGLDMEARIPEQADVAFVDPYEPTFFGFGDHRPGLRPSDFKLER